MNPQNQQIIKKDKVLQDKLQKSQCFTDRLAKYSLILLGFTACTCLCHLKDLVILGTTK